MPTLTTPRLLLRAFTFEDAPEVQRLTGEREVASTTKILRFMAFCEANT